MSSQKNKHNYFTDNFVRIIKTDIQNYGIKNIANHACSQMYAPTVIRKYIILVNQAPIDILFHSGGNHLGKSKNHLELCSSIENASNAIEKKGGVFIFMLLSFLIMLAGQGNQHQSSLSNGVPDTYSYIVFFGCCLYYFIHFGKNKILKKEILNIVENKNVELYNYENQILSDNETYFVNFNKDANYAKRLFSLHKDIYKIFKNSTSIVDLRGKLIKYEKLKISTFKIQLLYFVRPSGELRISISEIATSIIYYNKYFNQNILSRAYNAFFPKKKSRKKSKSKSRTKSRTKSKSKSRPKSK